jgi:soluble lytic murein transglycosylase-like protein
MSQLYQATREAMPVAIEGLAEASRTFGELVNILTGLVLDDYKISAPRVFNREKLKSELPVVDKINLGNLNANFYTEHYKPYVLGRETPEKDRHRKYFRSESVLRWKEEVETASKKYGVPKNVIFALIHQESGGNRIAKAKTSSAIGLTQLLKGTARSQGLRVGYDEKGEWIDERLDASKNIDAGVRYFKQQLKRFKGDVSLAIMAYHEGGGGANQVRRLAMTGRYEEARLRLKDEGLKYVPSVLEFMKLYDGV